MNRVKRAGERFALCIRNDHHPVSLEVRKVYPLLPDAAAAEHGMLRIVDESREDYLYPADDFLVLALGQTPEEALHEVL